MKTNLYQRRADDGDRARVLERVRGASEPWIVATRKVLDDLRSADDALERLNADHDRLLTLLAAARDEGAQARIRIEELTAELEAARMVILGAALGHERRMRSRLSVPLELHDVLQEATTAHEITIHGDALASFKARIAEFVAAKVERAQAQDEQKGAPKP
jgi:hypothetical protein